MNPQPKYPAGTPEYAAYAEALRAELAKFVAGEPPYAFGVIDELGFGVGGSDA